jgi:hypothetical protein
MRSMFRNVLVAIVAVLALSAVATATASAALPEIVNSKGEELVKKKFTGEVHGTDAVGLEISGRGSEQCEELSFAGGVKGTKGGEATLTLHCVASCHTKSSKEKEIKLPVSVNLVWLNKATERIALLLSISGVVDLEDYCWGYTMPSQFPLELSGSLLVPAGATNKLGTEYTLTPKQKESRQEPDEYENEAGGKVKAQLETTSGLYPEWENRPLGIETRIPMNFEEAAEFKA